MRLLQNRVALAAALGLATLVVFLPCIGDGWVSYDDGGYVFENAHVLAGLSPAGIAWAFTTTAMANWHPLTWLSLQLDATLFGPSPAGFHAVSVLLHALNAALAVLLFSALTGETLVALAAASLFALHPLRVESVAWIAERKDVLSGFFCLATLLLYVEGHRRGDRRLRSLAVVTFALGLLAKPMLVTVPPLLVVLDATFLDRFDKTARGFARLCLEKAPHALMAAGTSVVTLFAQRPAMVDVERYALDARLGNAVVSLARYLEKTAWPVSLSVVYAPRQDGWPALVVAGAAAVAVAVTLAVYAAGRGAPAVWGGWLWFCGMLVPVIGIVQVGSCAMDDRYTYLPHLGLFLALAVAVRRFGQGVPAVLLAAALALVPLSVRQIGVWSSTMTLFSHAVEVEPDNSFAHFRLADLWLEAGDPQKALAHAAVAAQYDPNSPKVIERLALALYATGNKAEAARALHAVLENSPDRGAAWLLLARIAGDEGRTDEAERDRARARAAFRAGCSDCDSSADKL